MESGNVENCCQTYECELNENARCAEMCHANPEYCIPTQHVWETLLHKIYIYIFFIILVTQIVTNVLPCCTRAFTRSRFSKVFVMRSMSLSHRPCTILIAISCCKWKTFPTHANLHVGAHRDDAAIPSSKIHFSSPHVNDEVMAPITWGWRELIFFSFLFVDLHFNSLLFLSIAKSRIPSWPGQW